MYCLHLHSLHTGISLEVHATLQPTRPALTSSLLWETLVSHKKLPVLMEPKSLLQSHYYGPLLDCINPFLYSCYISGIWTPHEYIKWSPVTCNFLHLTIISFLIPNIFSSSFSKAVMVLLFKKEKLPSYKSSIPGNFRRNVKISWLFNISGSDSTHIPLVTISKKQLNIKWLALPFHIWLVSAQRQHILTRLCGFHQSLQTNAD